MTAVKASIKLSGEVTIPNDKSITHRAILFSSIANGKSKIKFTSIGRDNLASLRVMRQLGAEVTGSLSKEVYELAKSEGVIQSMALWSRDYSELIVDGKGLHSLHAAGEVLDCGNSGTTSRLLCGILAGQKFKVTISGDSSLQSRPFKRITDPLSQMGAVFSSDNLPMSITGASLSPLEYQSPKASAQVKSAIFLAGLYCQKPVTVIESSLSRNHTELMLESMGAQIKSQQQLDLSWKITSDLNGELAPLEMEIPGDFSAAAFFMVAASIIPDSKILIKNVGFNSSRIGLLEILNKMGADIKPVGKRKVSGEDVVDLIVSYANLTGIDVDAKQVVHAIDEIPILAVAAAFANGTTTVSGASELRVKESDRIKMTVEFLSQYGVNIEEKEDGFIIKGGCFSEGRPSEAWKHCEDHRIFMGNAVLNLAINSKLELFEKSVVETSFPGFLEQFQGIIKEA